MVTNTQINIGDDWKTVDAMQINIGDAWKAVAGAQINIGDDWKTVFTGPFNGNATLTNGLEAFYGFTSDATDDSGNYDGTVDGATHASTGGVPGGKYGFDGTNDHISLGDWNPGDSNSRVAFSISLWIKSTDTTGYWFTRWIALDNSRYVRFYVNTNLNLIIGNSGGTGVGSRVEKAFTPSGDWQHIVGTWDSTGDGKARVYIDGTLWDTAPTGYTTALKDVSGDNTFLGQDNDGSGLEFTGDMDGVGVWNRALTTTEITALYNSGNGLTY